MRLSIIIGGLALLLAAFGVTGWVSYGAGKDAERASQAVLIEEAKDEERVVVKKVIEYRDKIKVVYRDRIKQILVAEDSTGCADVKLTDMGFGLHKDSQD